MAQEVPAVVGAYIPQVTVSVASQSTLAFKPSVTTERNNKHVE